MSFVDMAFVGLVVATFSFVGAAIYYGQRQTELAARARGRAEATAAPSPKQTSRPALVS